MDSWAHESNGLYYLGFNDGRSVRQWVFSKEAIDHADVNHALEALAEHEARDLLIVPTGPVVFSCRLLARGWRSNEISFERHPRASNRQENTTGPVGTISRSRASCSARASSA